MIRNDFGVVEINSIKELLAEIKLMLPYVTISLIGPSGTGKTALIESLKENASELGIDKIIPLRLQGLTSEDFRIPVLDSVEIEIDGKKIVERQVQFANIGIFKEIDENPDKKYLLFFDEIVRADRSVAPLLFSMLEGKMLDGIKRKNLYIMTAFNYGDEYESHIDFSDDALRRRQIFIQYNPSKEDFMNFIVKHNYHEIIQEVTEYLGINTIIDHESSKELMQPTTFGSWNLLNNRWKAMEEQMNIGRKGKDFIKLSYNDAKMDIQSKGALFFNDKTIHELVNKLTLLEELNTIDIQKEIIDKNGLDKDVVIYRKDKKIYDKKNREKELLIKTINFIRREVMKNSNYFENNADKILKLFKNENPLLVSMITQINVDLRRTFSNDGEMNETIMKKEKEIFTAFIKSIKKAMDQDESIRGLYAELQQLITFCKYA